LPLSILLVIGAWDFHDRRGTLFVLTKEILSENLR